MYMVSQPRPQYKSSPLWAPHILYHEHKEQLKQGRKCHIGKTELQEVQYVFKDTLFNTTFF
jgi:hypothetical protein